MGNGKAGSTGIKKVWIYILILAALILGWVFGKYGGGSQTPVFRRIRIANASKDIIQKAEVKAEVGGVKKTLATFNDLDSQKVDATDRDHLGFEVDGIFYPNVSKLFISIEMKDVATNAVVLLSEIPLDATGESFGGLHILIDDDPAAEKWQVLATGFHAADENHDLKAKDPLPKMTAGMP